MEKEKSIQNFFVGKISPFLLFEKEYHSLDYVVESHKNNRYYEENNPACQVAFIGILAYFEAYCKHQFAAVLNIFPSLINDFSDKRKNIKIDLSAILLLKEKTFENIGFLLAEKYDFGSASSINNNFRDLLTVTPFSQKDKDQFEKIVHKRNLLVHHAGYYTLKSLNSDENKHHDERERVFKENVIIDISHYQKSADFLFQMALKITRKSIEELKKLEEYNHINLNSLEFQAIEALGHGLYDKIN